MPDIVIRDNRTFRAINDAFREASNGKQLRKELTTEVRAVLRPLVPEVRGAYKAQPAYGRPHSRSRREQPPLRTLLAKATRVEVRFTGKRAGARIRVDGRRMPDGMKSLPAYWEGEKPRWRWPVFGDREVWVQGHARPTFYRVVEPHVPDAQRAIDAAASAVLKRIERAR
jgi:hypothetical protein